MLTAQCSYHLNCHVKDMTLSLQCYSQQVNILWLTRKATMQWVIFQPFCTIALCSKDFVIFLVSECVCLIM